MSDKQKSAQSSRKPKTSASVNGGGGKVFHTVTIVKEDETVTVNRRGLSDLDIVLMKRPGTKSRAVNRAGRPKAFKHELA